MDTDPIDRTALDRRFAEVDAHLKALTDEDPTAAVEAARALVVDGILNQGSLDVLRAGNLIDAGAAARDPQAVDEGVAILERLMEAAPRRGDIQYCLANGLCAQADLAPHRGASWYLETREVRRRARSLYRLAALEPSTPPTLAAEAHTNRANSLLRAYRFVEAYDAYLKALESDSTNGVALTGAARVLLRFAKRHIGDAEVLQTLAAGYLARAKENPERIRELAGEQAYAQLAPLLESEIPTGAVPDLSGASDYQRFVARHRLSLTPTIEGLDLSLARWDSLRIGGIAEHISAGSGVPPLFAMFNVLKGDFLAARYLGFFALEGSLPESGRYADTLDYARYGIQPSMLTLAQRASLDLLDKVAVAASEYLDLPGDPAHIYFRSRWFEPHKAGEPARWRSQVEEEIAKGNGALIAISEVAGDIQAGGFLEAKRMLRHASTHRFAVLHDLGASPSRESKYIQHAGVGEVVSELVETLRLARAVLLYFVEMVAIREHRGHRDDVVRVPLILPDHDWARGGEGA
jgi:tetratricopeptide (TPR) repeat protein